MFSIPPVPNVIFAGPGRTHACPRSDACWSPTSAAIGGAPGSAVAGPMMPLVSTIVGSIDSGMCSASSACGHQPRPSWCITPVTPALLASVTWNAPSVSSHVIHESTVPKQQVALSGPGS